MRAWLILGLCLSPSVTIGLWAAGVYLYDRRRDRQACERLIAMEQAAAERLRSGAAWVEAFALQLDEIQSLPEVDRWCV